VEQRRLRPGDVVDDYCPRERRLTDHAIVALIDDSIKQVRCVSCDAEHEYKEARVPAPRKKKPADALHHPEPPAPPRAAHDEPGPEDTAGDPAAAPLPAPLPHLVAPPPPEPEVAPEPPPTAPAPDPDEGPEESALPMIARRRGDALSRHALRPPTEPGETDPMRPVRQMPDFTVRQPGARPAGGGRGRGGRGRGQGAGPGQPIGPMRTGQGSHGQGHDGHGPGGNRQGRGGQGHGQAQGQGPRGSRQGGGHADGRPGGGGGGRNRRGGRGRGKKG
jgi:translation initiation factor IF-2